MSKDKKEYLEIYQKIGQNIKKQRLLKQFSQEELAFKIGSARNYIGCIERGEKFPSVAILYDIAKALDLPMKDLFL